MNSYSFRRHPLEFANEAWRPLDRALLRWVLAHGGSERLATAAAWASRADGDGDSAVLLPSAPTDFGPTDLRPTDFGPTDSRPTHPNPPSTRAHPTAAWSPEDVAALRDESMVAADDVGPARPFVLDADGRFYLWRNRRDESAVVEQVCRRRLEAVQAPGDEAGIDALFHGRADAAIASQRAAVRQVAGRRLFVLTGGPGTGKTTTVLRMLLMLQHAAAAPLAIRLAAPTGKAAQRLAQALRDGKRGLRQHPDAPLPPAWLPLLDRIPDEDATTLHRLLDYQPWNNRFGRDAENPLTADVVVVDEASMIDLAMLRKLLDALRPDASLILLGDADQLASIGVGSVLMDLVEAFEAGGGADIVRLAHSFRSERSLAAVHAAVRRGDPGAFAQAAQQAGERFFERGVTDARRLAGALSGWADALAGLDLRPAMVSGEPAQAERVRAALRALSTRQLLCALREGAFGSLAADATIQHALRRAWGVADGAPWYAGRAVMVTRNDHGMRLSNGDIGLCLEDADGALRVWFEGGDATGQPALRAFAPAALPPHEGAFAITIHKSQGSEYDHVAVLLPPDPDSPVLSRQLLYTGLSRARQSVELWASPAAAAAALARAVRRVGGLASRIGSEGPGRPAG